MAWRRDGSACRVSLRASQAAFTQGSRRATTRRARIALAGPCTRVASSLLRANRLRAQSLPAQAHAMRDAGAVRQALAEAGFFYCPDARVEDRAVPRPAPPHPTLPRPAPPRLAPPRATPAGRSLRVSVSSEGGRACPPTRGRPAGLLRVREGDPWLAPARRAALRALQGACPLSPLCEQRVQRGCGDGCALLHAWPWGWGVWSEGGWFTRTSEDAEAAPWPCAHCVQTDQCCVHGSMLSPMEL